MSSDPLAHLPSFHPASFLETPIASESSAIPLDTNTADAQLPDSQSRPAHPAHGSKRFLARNQKKRSTDEALGTEEGGTDSTRPTRKRPKVSISMSMPGIGRSTVKLFKSVFSRQHSNAGNAMELDSHDVHAPSGALLAQGADAQRKLNALKKEARADLEEALHLHAAIKKALGNVNTSHAARSLTQEQISSIRELEAYIVEADAIMAILDGMPPLSPNANTEDQKSYARQLYDFFTAGKGLAALEALLAMGMKNSAWYLTELLPESIVLRTVVGLLAAAFLEYPPGTDSLRRWEAHGGSVNNWVGMNQGFDMGTSLLLLSLLGQKTGETIAGYDTAGYVFSAAAAAAQSGMASNVLKYAIRWYRGENGNAQESFSQIAELPQETAARQAAEDGMPALEGDLERGQPGLPAAAAARQQAAPLKDLFSAFPRTKLKAMKQRMNTTCGHIDEMQSVLRQLAQQRAQANPVNPVSEDNAPQETHQAERSHEEQLDLMNEDLAQIEENLTRLKAHLTKLAGQPDAVPEHAHQLADIEKALRSLEESKNELAKSGGMSNEAKLFFGSSTVLYLLGTVASLVGPAVEAKTGWKGLSDLNTRATLLGVTSSIAQAFANLGQFLGGADPDDATWKKVLQFGADHSEYGDDHFEDSEDLKKLFKLFGIHLDDNTDHSPKVKKIRNWARSVRWLLFEFPLLQASTTLSQRAKQEAGTNPDAPKAVIPSASNIRNIQEFARSLMSLLFTVTAMGAKLKPHHVAGPILNFAGAATSTGLQVKAEAG